MPDNVRAIIITGIQPTVMNQWRPDSLVRPHELITANAGRTPTTGFISWFLRQLKSTYPTATELVRKTTPYRSVTSSAVRDLQDPKKEAG